ncbi:hypothetical protein [Oceaniglobus indicus]|uniref:hypothetical protein n=1 Tax=Oceaniglobus indicus TaxID=2047749 RepID=UPI000C19A7F9|nr:hypothetical protein [Oceaniglobus indicus]
MLRLTKTPIQALAALALGSFLCAPVAAQEADGVHPVDFEAPVSDDMSLRALSEIDGDLSTFTEKERRKMLVLAQVLGTSPIEETDHLQANS